MTGSDSPFEGSPSPEDSGSGYAVDWAHREGAVGEILEELGRRDARRRRILAGGGAALLLLAAAAGLFSFRKFYIPLSRSQTVVVSAAKQRVLPDGSVAELKDDAEISVAFDAGSTGPRQIYLQRGEAHFAVAKDPNRPFIVSAAGVEVRAIGTAFSVGLSSKAVEVLVNEGRVVVDQVQANSSPGALSASPSGLNPTAFTIGTVSAGGGLVVPVRNRVIGPKIATPFAISSAEMAERMAWRVPKLEFSATPLAEAVAMFNRHNDDRLILADDSLGRLEVSGILGADKVETFVQMLETNFGLKVERPEPHMIVIRRP